jgi:hypothetical protein
MGRRHYGRWLLLVTTMLAPFVAGILLLLWNAPRPPKAAVDLFDKLKIGANHPEVPLFIPELEFMGWNAWSFGSEESWLAEGGWMISATFDEQGKLVDRSLYLPQPTPWYKRAWAFFQRSIRSLPDLPF